ncbi:MAG: sugar ABC transporter permease [Anaerolineae bacterium]|nr:sugar ABC transporter permease [Anaerolineae bacterium]
MSVRTTWFQGSRRARSEALWSYVLISPWILGFLIWILYPMLASVYYSMTKYSLLKPPTWIGGENFSTLFRDPLFWQSLRVTVLFSVSYVPLALAFALLLASLLNQQIRGLAFFRAAFYLPSVVSGVAISMLWMWGFSNYGFVNGFLRLFGIKLTSWWTNERLALPAMVIYSVWLVGGTMIVFLAGLQAIPRHLYEAAEIDGANSVKKFRYITLPMLSATMFFNLVMGLIAAFQTFTGGFVITKGGPNYATLFYNLYLYENAFTKLKMGYASAQAWVLFAIILVLTLIVFRSSAVWVYYEGEVRK